MFCAFFYGKRLLRPLQFLKFFDMSKQLLQLPNDILRQILEFAIDAYTAENVKVYTQICRQIYILFKVIVQVQVERFFANPFLFKFYKMNSFSYVLDPFVIAALIKFNYSGSDESKAQQVIEFMKTCVLNDKAKFNVTSMEVLTKIINGRSRKFERITKLDYGKAIGPIIIELFTRKWDNLEILMKVSAFFNHPESFFVFMTSGAINWMQSRSIPASVEERDQLIHRIYEARIRMMLLRCGIAAFTTSIVYLIYLVRHPLENFMNDLPYLILEAIFPQFIINTPFQFVQFGVFNSGSDSEFETIDEKGLDYLSDRGQAN